MNCVMHQGSRILSQSYWLLEMDPTPLTLLKHKGQIYWLSSLARQQLYSQDFCPQGTLCLAITPYLSRQRASYYPIAYETQSTSLCVTQYVQGKYFTAVRHPLRIKKRKWEIILSNTYKVTVIILDIIHRPAFYLKHTVSENGPETVTSSVYWTQLSRFHLKTETESSLRKVAF
jgi:hypothetical protein